MNSLWHFPSSLLKRLLPSFRVGRDPLALADRSGGRYVPIPISTMKLTPLIKHQVLALRQPQAFQMEEGRRLAIVIPYRNRAEHLARLVPVLRQTLAAAAIDARILVVEQAGSDLFNRGMLMNVGAHRLGSSCDYLCFHDVDLIPEQADYRCPSQPLRLITQLSYTHRDFSNLSGPNLGGAISMRRDQFALINGFSNRYRGWGQEDDDLLMRCLLSGLVPHVDREGRYADLDTPAAEVQINRVVARLGSNRALKSAMWRGLSDFRHEGLNTLHYSVVSEHAGDGFHQLCVRID